MLNLAKLAAPFLPFLSEEIYLNLKKPRLAESVHLCDYPATEKKLINKKLEEKMSQVRAIVALALAQRAGAGIKVRQPLASLEIKDQTFVPSSGQGKSNIKNDKDFLDLIKDEVNVKLIKFNPELKSEIKLDKKITKELKEEGVARELVRQIQDMRKELGLTRKDRIAINFKFQISNFKLKKIFANWSDFIFRETLAQKIDDEQTG